MHHIFVFNKEHRLGCDVQSCPFNKSQELPWKILLKFGDHHKKKVLNPYDASSEKESKAQIVKVYVTPAS